MSKKHHEAHLHGKTSFFSKFQEYIGEFIYGGIDGSVTTFAVVAGAAGANLDSAVVIILGFANLFADGFAMSVGSYLSTKSEKQNYEKHKAIEYWEVDHLPEKEREEIREIYQAKGFEGELLEQVVDKITEDKDRWVAFGAIGYAKSYVTSTSRVRGVLETLFLGGSAAVLAYYVGVILESMIS